MVRSKAQGVYMADTGTGTKVAETPLLIEVAFFEKKEAELLKKYKGQFVLIKGEEIFGAFPDQQAAFRAGIRRFGLETFLVRQVVESRSVALSPLLAIGAHL